MAFKIVSSILGETPVVKIMENRVDIHVDCGDDSGLLIGREGQTLAALRYLTSRIVSRRMEAPVRVQFDVGDYRERQDDRLRELALSRWRNVSVPRASCSTRPMSSYHRRLVHMALQDSPDVQTRSSGEGPPQARDHPAPPSGTALEILGGRNLSEERLPPLPKPLPLRLQRRSLWGQG